jgi:hypothetical protein
MQGYSNAFISYQTSDQKTAARVREALKPAGIAGFLAHEDIEVSAEWRGRLLQELARCDVFVALLSNAYLGSYWCLQESGIAATKPDLLVVPLSLDGTIPPAFLGAVQSRRLNTESLSSTTFAPAYLTKDPAKGLNNLISVLSHAGNYRSAEETFALAVPHIKTMDSEHVVNILTVALENDQVCNAAKCAKDYIPAILRAHPHVGSRKLRSDLKKICNRYGAGI